MLLTHNAGKKRLNLTEGCDLTSLYDRLPHPWEIRELFVKLSDTLRPRTYI